MLSVFKGKLIKMDYEDVYKNFKLKNILIPILLCSKQKKMFSIPMLK